MPEPEDMGALLNALPVIERNIREGRDAEIPGHGSILPLPENQRQFALTILAQVRDYATRAQFAEKDGETQKATDFKNGAYQRLEALAAGVEPEALHELLEKVSYGSKHIPMLIRTARAAAERATTIPKEYAGAAEFATERGVDASRQRIAYSRSAFDRHLTIALPVRGNRQRPPG